MIYKTTTCCFTGHRENKLPWRGDENDPRCQKLKQRIFDTVDAVYNAGIRHYICGMAHGCDFFFCEAVIALKRQYGDITLEAAMPFEAQSKRWPPRLQNRYQRLVAECDYETLVQKEYTQDCMMRRNRYMVDNSAILIAVYNGATGGTFNTIRYALSKNVEIIELYVDET